MNIGTIRLFAYTVTQTVRNSLLWCILRDYATCLNRGKKILELRINKLIPRWDVEKDLELVHKYGEISPINGTVGWPVQWHGFFFMLLMDWAWAHARPELQSLTTINKELRNGRGSQYRKQNRNEWSTGDRNAVNQSSNSSRGSNRRQPLLFNNEHTRTGIPTITRSN